MVLCFGGGGSSGSTSSVEMTTFLEFYCSDLYASDYKIRCLLLLSAQLLSVIFTVKILNSRVDGSVL